MSMSEAQHDSGGGAGTATARKVDVEQTVKLELVKRSEKRQQTTFFSLFPSLCFSNKANNFAGMQQGLFAVYSTVILENIGDLRKVSVPTCECIFAFGLTVYIT